MSTVLRRRSGSSDPATASATGRPVDLTSLPVRLRSLSVIVALILTMTSLEVVAAEGSAPASAAASVTITSNINYGPAKLDLYFSGAKTGPLRRAIILVHGGGWTGGDKTTPEMVTAAKDMANAGYAVFDINYPLASATVSGYPMQIQAIVTAEKYVKTNSAKYYVDPARVGLLGGSAGANLVYMAGLLSNQNKPGYIRAVAGLSGYTQLWETYLSGLSAQAANPTDQSIITGFTNLEDYLGCPTGNCSETTADAASPYNNVNPNCPATDIWNSDNEPVPLEQVYNFSNALTAAGCTVQVDIVPGTAHAFKYWPTAKSGVIDFFNRNL
jgi:acetyl esterase